MSIAWVKQIVEDCDDAGIAVFVKQLGRRPTHCFPLSDRKGGDMSEWPRHLRVREIPFAAVSW